MRQVILETNNILDLAHDPFVISHAAEEEIPKFYNEISPLILSKKVHANKKQLCWSYNNRI